MARVVFGFKFGLFGFISFFFRRYIGFFIEMMEFVLTSGFRIIGTCWGYGGFFIDVSGWFVRRTVRILEEFGR